MVAVGGTQVPYRTLRWHSRRGGLEGELGAVFDRLDEQLKDAAPESRPAWSTDLGASVADCRKLLSAHARELLTQELKLPAIGGAKDASGRRTRWDAAWVEMEAKQQAWERRWEEAFRTFLARLEAVKADAPGGGAAGRLGKEILSLGQFADRLSSSLKIRRSLDIARDDKQSREELYGLATVPRS